MDALHLDFFIDLYLGADNAFQLAFQGFRQFLRCGVGSLQNAHLLLRNIDRCTVFPHKQKNDEQDNHYADEIQGISVQLSAAALPHPFFLRFRRFSIFSAAAVPAASDRLAAAVMHTFFPFGKHCISHGSPPFILQKMTNYH